MYKDAEEEEEEEEAVNRWIILFKIFDGKTQEYFLKQAWEEGRRGRHWPCRLGTGPGTFF